tara:strand:+ start:499 stop:642 length:144 start_codon:yes stop_codon:yes gene_type:complete
MPQTIKNYLLELLEIEQTKLENFNDKETFQDTLDLINKSINYLNNIN